MIVPAFFLDTRVHQIFTMPAEEIKRRARFTTAEKWLIWGVFCLLVGLSTYRFAVFSGLMLGSFGVSLLVKKQKIVLGLFICVIGLLSLIFSKVLI